jgi:hypothetical protein
MKPFFFAIILCFLHNRLFCGIEATITKVQQPLSDSSVLLNKKNINELKKQYCSNEQLELYINQLTLLDYSDTSKKNKCFKKKIKKLDYYNYRKFCNYLKIATVASYCISKYKEDTKDPLNNILINASLFVNFYTTKNVPKPTEWIAQTLALIFKKRVITNSNPGDIIDSQWEYQETFPHFNFAGVNIEKKAEKVIHSIIKDCDTIPQTLDRIQYQTTLKAFELLNKKKIQRIGTKKIIETELTQHHQDLANKNSGNSKDACLSHATIEVKSMTPSISFADFDADNGIVRHNKDNKETFIEKRNAFLENCRRAALRCHFRLCCAKTDLHCSNEYLPALPTTPDSF